MIQITSSSSHYHRILQLLPFSHAKLPNTCPFSVLSPLALIAGIIFVFSVLWLSYFALPIELPFGIAVSVIFLLLLLLLPSLIQALSTLFPASLFFLLYFLLFPFFSEFPCLIYVLRVIQIFEAST